MTDQQNTCDIRRKAGPRRKNGAGRPDTEDGAVAVELAFGLPVLLMLMLGSMELGAIFFIKNHMTSVASDVARRVAIGEVGAPEAESMARDRLIDWGIDYSVDVTLPDPLDPTDKDIEVLIRAPMSQASITDFPIPFGTAEISALAIQRDEQL